MKKRTKVRCRRISDAAELALPTPINRRALGQCMAEEGTTVPSNAFGHAQSVAPQPAGMILPAAFYSKPR